MTKNPIPLPEFDADKLRFGACPTDHMLIADYYSETGKFIGLVEFFLITTFFKGWDKP